MIKGSPETTTAIELKPEILNFKDFTYRDHGNPRPRYNNFFLFFAGGKEEELKNIKPFFRKFLLEHKDMADLLCHDIQNREMFKKDQFENLIPLFIGDSLEPFNKRLYDVYKILRSYGVSDEELFN